MIMSCDTSHFKRGKYSSAMLCRCSRNNKHPNFEWRGQGRGADSFVLWSHPIRAQCLNNFVTDCRYISHRLLSPSSQIIHELGLKDNGIWESTWVKNFVPVNLILTCNIIYSIHSSKYDGTSFSNQIKFYLTSWFLRNFMLDILKVIFWTKYVWCFRIRNFQSGFKTIHVWLFKLVRDVDKCL